MSGLSDRYPDGRRIWILVNSDWSGDAKVCWFEPPDGPFADDTGAPPFSNELIESRTRTWIINGRHLALGHTPPEARFIGYQAEDLHPVPAWVIARAVALAVQDRALRRLMRRIEDIIDA